jgi:hypothetical protein
VKHAEDILETRNELAHKGIDGQSQMPNPYTSMGLISLEKTAKDVTHYRK